MMLWVKGKPGSASAVIREIAGERVSSVSRQAVARGTQAVNALRNAELQVLKGQRSGRVYKKPGTYGKRLSKATKELKGEYGHKLRGGQLYRASAPGEPPAKRTGNLRLHWNGRVIKENTSGGGVMVTAELKSHEPYAGILEHGTSRMAPRPFVEKIKQGAMPKIKNIYNRPYT